MSLRPFTDTSGNEWHAFDVVPLDRERRTYDRRISSETKAVDERRGVDRRLTVGSIGVIAGGQGWLCFEHDSERRRLSPIPPDWRRCDETQLARYLEAARPVRRHSSSFGQVADRD